MEEVVCAKHNAIKRAFSKQTKEGYWISKRISDSRSSNVDGHVYVEEPVPRLEERHARARSSPLGTWKLLNVEDLTLTQDMPDICGRMVPHSVLGGSVRLPRYVVILG
ncbi:MAG: hypothetical protein NWF14_01060 [Candidatus Bathyarchaeota archaeon]|nr:hypothetical protein [Candidatus Bathyarchaeota archaeon]